ncbi:MAG: hypothetical protein DRI90_19830 [Deltaproteobacteria bacterium]|nr:MAG: hypothetical protein DRI90_19830 [Deltaproteobacteria bacterium]
MLIDGTFSVAARISAAVLPCIEDREWQREHSCAIIAVAAAAGSNVALLLAADDGWDEPSQPSAAMAMTTSQDHRAPAAGLPSVPAARKPAA